MPTAASMIQLLPNFAAAIDAQLASAQLVARLKETYGLPALKVDALDEEAVARTVAMLDFLSNNLPVTSKESWLGWML